MGLALGVYEGNHHFRRRSSLSLDEKSRCLAQNFIAPPKLPVFTLKLLEPLTLRHGQAGTKPLIPLGLMKPASKILAGTADLGRYRTDSLSAGLVFILVLQHHPYRPFLKLWGISDSLAHDSISSNGVSGNHGAVHHALKTVPLPSG